MTDRLTKEQRSWIMAQIKGKDTKPEFLVRSMLHRAGYPLQLAFYLVVFPVFAFHINMHSFVAIGAEECKTGKGDLVTGRVS